MRSSSRERIYRTLISMSGLYACRVIALRLRVCEKTTRYRLAKPWNSMKRHALRYITLSVITAGAESARDRRLSAHPRDSPFVHALRKQNLNKQRAREMFYRVATAHHYFAVFACGKLRIIKCDVADLPKNSLKVQDRSSAFHSAGTIFLLFNQY